MALLTQQNIGNRLSWIIFIVIYIQTVQTLATYSDIPPPPPRPDRFHSRDELRQYLQRVHEYYAIIGRPRFGRSLSDLKSSLNDRRLFDFFDVNGDQLITFDEFHNLLGIE